MLHISKTAGYAVHALSHLGNGHSQPRFIKDIAAALRLPKPYLARIFNLLEHRGVVVAKRGYRGGVTLAKPPSEITLLDIVEAVEEKSWFGPCVFGLEKCPVNHRCPAHGKWAKLCEQTSALLRKTTLADVASAAE
jgi:Rrf2 family protein